MGAPNLESNSPAFSIVPKGIQNAGSRISSAANKINGTRNKIIEGVDFAGNADIAERRKFETIKQNISSEIAQIDAEIKQVMKNINDIKSEVLSFRKQILKYLKSAVGIKTGKIEQQSKTLKQSIENLKVLIPELLKKIALFIASAESRLKELNPKTQELFQDIEIYRQELREGTDRFKAALGPASSQILTIAATYLNAMKKLNDLKKIIKALKVGKAVAATPGLLPLVLVGIVVTMAVVLFFFIYPLLTIQDDPGKALEFAFNNSQCVTNSDPAACLEDVINDHTDESNSSRTI